MGSVVFVNFIKLNCMYVEESNLVLAQVARIRLFLGCCFLLMLLK